MGKVGLFKKWARKIRHKFGPKLDPNTATPKQALQWFEDRREGYERMVAPILPYVPRDGVVFDIGANIGFFSKVLTEKTPFAGSLYLFEPVPNLSRISRTLFQSTPFKVHVFPYGLGERNAELPMHTSRNGNIGWSTFISEKASPDMDLTKVRVMAFDSTGIKVRPSFIKIDVEGSEYRVLQGMMGSLARWKPKPVILCELSWGKDHPHWRKQVSVFDRLLRLGYTAYLDGKKIGFDQVHHESVTTDYLFLPKGRKFVPAGS